MHSLDVGDVVMFTDTVICDGTLYGEVGVITKVFSTDSTGEFCQVQWSNQNLASNNRAGKMLSCAFFSCDNFTIVMKKEEVHPACIERVVGC